MSVDLTTRYLGLRLRNPLIASACTLTGRLAATGATVVAISAYQRAHPGAHAWR